MRYRRDGCLTATRRAFLRDALASAFGLALADSRGVRAAGRRPRVGLLFFGAMPGAGHRDEPIVRSLAALGWSDGATIEYTARYAHGRRDAYAELVSELAARSPDVVFCAGSDIARALVALPPAIPVVFAVSDDPMASGLVASLARPRGRFTGVSFMSPELAGKRLELLLEIVPAMRRVAVLTDAGHDALYVPRFAQAAAARSLELVPFRFEQPADFRTAFASAAEKRADAMFVVPSRFTLAYAREIADLSIAHRLPAISAYDAFARGGGLASYGPTSAEVVSRAASFVDRILRGARVADLPVEQASGVALLVNGRTAAALGVTLPASVLLRADEVIQ